MWVTELWQEEEHGLSYVWRMVGRLLLVVYVGLGSVNALSLNTGR